MADDLTIDDGCLIYRRVNPEHHTRWDENRNCRRFTSAAFQNGTDDEGNKTLKMSTALDDTLRTEGREPSDILVRANVPDWYLVVFAAAHARAHGQEIERDPTAEEPAHSHVVGAKGDGVRGHLAKGARWEIAPEDACPSEADS
jgi:hypothetical protein